MRFTFFSTEMRRDIFLTPGVANFPSAAFFSARPCWQNASPATFFGNAYCAETFAGTFFWHFFLSLTFFRHFFDICLTFFDISLRSNFELKLFQHALSVMGKYFNRRGMPGPRLITSFISLLFHMHMISIDLCRRIMGADLCIDVDSHIRSRTPQITYPLLRERCWWSHLLPAGLWNRLKKKLKQKANIWH